MPQLDRQVLDAHEQTDLYSCIPACVELVLKLLGRVPQPFVAEQRAWANRVDGSFGNYNGKAVGGITFRHLFHDLRGATFPLNELFSRIDAELQAERFVIISLMSNGGWHMWVVYAKDGDEYLAVSKASPPNGKVSLRCQSVRHLVTVMRGTDILVYD